MVKCIMKIWIEKNCTWVFAVSASIVVFTSGLTACAFSDFSGLVSAMISVCSIIIGFLAAVISILVAIPFKRVFKRLFRHKMHARFISYVIQPLIIGVLAIIFSMVFYYVDSTFNASFPGRVYLSFWTGLITAFSISSMRILNYFGIILKKIYDEYADEANGINHHSPIVSAPEKLFELDSSEDKSDGH